MCLKRSCAQQNTVRKLFKGAFACQRPQLYTNQISRRSVQRQTRLSRDKNADRRTDGFSALYSRRLWQKARARRKHERQRVHHGWRLGTRLMQIFLVSQLKISTFGRCMRTVASYRRRNRIDLARYSST